MQTRLNQLQTSRRFRKQQQQPCLLERTRWCLVYKRKPSISIEIFLDTMWCRWMEEMVPPPFANDMFSFNSPVSRGTMTNANLACTQFYNQ